jgi:hypothetical protein
MSVRYDDRLNRVHQPVAHDPHDTTPVDIAEHGLSIYAKRIIAIHNALLEKGILPTFDPIRRTAEELDALFDRGTPPDTVPPALHRRLPDYYERRVLAIEKWLVDQGVISAEEVRSYVDALDLPDALK